MSSNSALAPKGVQPLAGVVQAAEQPHRPVPLGRRGKEVGRAGQRRHVMRLPIVSVFEQKS